MDAMNLPIFPVDEEAKKNLVFLPGVDTDEIEDLMYEFDEDESVLIVYCIYGEDEDGEPIGNSYPIAIGEDEHELVRGIEELMVLGPEDVDPSELTEDPDSQEEIEALFDKLRDIEDEWEERMEEA
jgi:hypothetical protein